MRGKKVNLDDLETNWEGPKTKGLLLIPVLLTWVGLFLGRRFWFTPWCANLSATENTPCTVDSVNAFDRIVFSTGDIFWDFLSNIVQNTTATVAFLLPLALYLPRFKLKAAHEMLFLLHATVWNLLANEVVRAIAQRPRPLVFNSPLGDGAQIHQYTSFYSGHTSFVALISLAMAFVVARRFRQKQWLHRTMLILYVSLGASTGLLRVLGGRHYPTDVIAGFIAGSLIAILANRWYFEKPDPVKL